MDKSLIDSFSIKVAGRGITHPIDSNKKRWLDDGEIITLSVKQKTYRNVEFKVNNDDNHIIWFTQLSTIFFELTNLRLVSGDLILKNGEEKIICNISPTEFVEIVKNKKFKVKRNSDGNVAKFDEKNLPCATHTECAELIRNLLKAGEIDRAADYLTPTTEYSLIEV